MVKSSSLPESTTPHVESISANIEFKLRGLEGITTDKDSKEKKKFLFLD